MSLKQLVPALISILIALSAGIIGSLVTFPNINTWYASLNKPFFNPPGWLFGPVWTILYILIGTAAFLVWQNRKNKRDYLQACKWYFIQLILNSLWSVIFFALKTPWIAFVEIIILWYAIFRTLNLFRKINYRAAYLLYPYLAWVSFAAILNLAVGILN